MSGDLFALVALGPLLLFILWEMWRNRPGALKRRAETADGFLPGGSAHEVGLFVLAAVFVACAVVVWVSPDVATSGRLAHLLRLLDPWVGALAAPLLFLAAAAAASSAGLTARRKRLASTRRETL